MDTLSATLSHPEVRGELMVVNTELDSSRIIYEDRNDTQFDYDTFSTCCFGSRSSGC